MGQADFARIGLLQRLAIELPPENEPEIERRSETSPVGPAVLVGHAAAAAEPRSLGSCSAQDFVPPKAADVVTFVASGTGQDSRLAYWYLRVPRVALPPATSIRPPAAPGNDQGYPRTV